MDGVESRVEQIDLSARGTLKRREKKKRKVIWIVTNPFFPRQLLWLGLMKSNRCSNRLSANLLFVVCGLNWLACAALWLLFINFDCNHRRLIWLTNTGPTDGRSEHSLWVPPATDCIICLGQGRPGPLASSGKHSGFSSSWSSRFSSIYLLFVFGHAVIAAHKKAKSKKTAAKNIKPATHWTTYLYFNLHASRRVCGIMFTWELHLFHGGFGNPNISQMKAKHIL